MSKVIVERPRMRRPARWAGSPYPRTHLAHLYERDLESAPSKLGMSAGHKEKWLNENLAPLRRFLLAQVGRPWDAVFKEIAAHVRVTSAVQAHIKQHLFDYVTRAVTTIDGVLFGATGYGLRPLVDRRHRDTMYVCPRTGILRLAPRAQKPRARFGRVVRIDAMNELREVDGKWQHVTLDRIPPNLVPGTIFDVLLDDHLDAAWFGPDQRYQTIFGRAHAYAAALRDLGRRERARVAALDATGAKGTSRGRR